MKYQPDKWARRAKEEGYSARSAYKLLALDREFSLLEEGDLVLDLGSAPGSWVQVALKKIGAKGFVVGVDLGPVDIKKVANPVRSRARAGAPEGPGGRATSNGVNFAFLRKDIYDADLGTELNKIIKKPFDVILSDAAPKTTGQKDVDQWRSHELSLRVFDIVVDELKKGGSAVVKIFEGPDSPELIGLFKEKFAKVNLVKPEASTKGSQEAYIVAKNFFSQI